MITELKLVQGETSDGIPTRTYIATNSDGESAEVTYVLNGDNDVTRMVTTVLRHAMQEKYAGVGVDSEAFVVPGDTDDQFFVFAPSQLDVVPYVVTVSRCCSKLEKRADGTLGRPADKVPEVAAA